jgi:hypothetical protein
MALRLDWGPSGGAPGAPNGFTRGVRGGNSGTRSNNRLPALHRGEIWLRKLRRLVVDTWGLLVK